MSTLRRIWKPRYLILVLVLPLFGWALRSVPVGEIASTLGRLSLGQLAVIAVLNIIILLLFSSRWWLFLRAQGYRLPYFSLVSYRLAAFGISYFTPGPQMGGEPLQVYLLRDRHALPTSTAIAAVSLDKLVELMTNFTFVAAGLLLVLRMGTSAQLPLYPLIFIFFLLLALPAGYLMSLWIGKRPFSRLSHILAARSKGMPALQSALRTAVSSEADMAGLFKRKPVVLLLSLLFSLLVWTCMILEYRLTLSFLGQPVSWLATIYLLIAARIAFLLPSPGGLGTLEAGQVLAMQSLGLSPALGISISLLIRTRDLALGSLGLWLGAYLTQRSPDKALPSQAGD